MSVWVGTHLSIFSDAPSQMPTLVYSPLQAEGGDVLTWMCACGGCIHQPHDGGTCGDGGAPIGSALCSRWYPWSPAAQQSGDGGS